MSEKAIFLSALDRETPAERAAFLSEACGQNADLRRAVESLLAAHDRAHNVLDHLPPPLAGTQLPLEVLGEDSRATAGPLARTAASADRTGEVIGAYRLMEKIGEGGFGQVYVAEQQQPVRRRVALKVLKPGMDSREVVARFEAERQALALMDHPNIARVFDAGATASGQPYFVMELVRGVPITQFCDQRQLTTRERLRLFVDVCQAVQHAHQKGVIHRDLKPSNVMVTLHDSMPVAKVIDFGVAKAISEPLTARTLYTRFAQMIGTPLYMSPEQAEMSGLDVDTRSDIYSLGVVLYELLTGTTPFDQRRMQTATFDELRRMIREEEPPRPSVRLTAAMHLLTTVSANQGTDPRGLSAMLRGDLDWIVMKALEKDRGRRYQTATEFAGDVVNYLDEKPVVARPPSRWYRFSKLARRNKVALTTVSLVLAALVIGTAVSAWQAVLATRARAEADALRQEAVDFAERLKEANVLLDSAQANAAEQRWSLAFSQFGKAAGLQPEHYLVWSARGSLYVRLGYWQLAASDYAKALQLGAPANNPGWWGVPQLFAYVEDDRSYRRICELTGKQLEASSDPAFISFAIRSLTVAESGVADAAKLAERAEKLLTDWPGEPFGRPAFDPGGPPPPGMGPPPLNGRTPPTASPGKMPAFPALGVPTGLPAYVAGLAHLRAGAGELAISRLRQSVQADRRWRAAPIGYPALALAYQRQGQRAEAEQALARAGEAIAIWADAFQEGSPESLPIPWFDYVECLTIFREAQAVLSGGDRESSSD